MIAIDTNLLVYAHRSLFPEHRKAKASIEKAADNDSGWGIALPSLSEFWTVVTHQRCEGRPSTAEQAEGFLTALIETANIQIFLPNDAFPTSLIITARNLGIQGVRIFDLQIALLSIAAGAQELWTHNAGFVKVPGIKVIDPLI